MMVFTVADDVSHPDQASVSMGKQRKNASSGRKGKGSLSTLMPKLKDQTPLSTTTGTDNNHAAEMSLPVPVLEPESTIMTRPTNNESLGSSAYFTGDKDPSQLTFDSFVHNPNDFDGSKESILQEINPTHSPVNSEKKAKDLQHQNFQGDGNEGGADIARLKQLLLLQVSLISRQQDLLRLRDREIMQLKASNTSYKCQLNRVRRRMSKKRVDGHTEESPKSSKRKSIDNSTDNLLPDDADGTVLGNVDDVLEPDSSLIKLSEAMKKNKKRRFNTSEGDVAEDARNLFDPSNMESSKLLEFSEAADITMTPSSRKDVVPVPISFIEQKQTELMQAMMVSPPEKAIRTFCDITSSSPPLDKFPFKICNRCPHCVAVAQEISRLLKTAENSQPFAHYQPKIMKPADKEILRLAGVVSLSNENEEHVYKVHGKYTQIMRTSVSYFRIPPMFDAHHWWWDLKCDNIKAVSSLKIPTWKERERVPLTTDYKEEVSEPTDDQTFAKRHAKLEQDEKRRKRWDIQRIREYRYNEKLRQKLLKQGAVYEAPVIETFAGHLHDAESVEVQESLPVNIFGYPLPHMDIEEFDPTPMRNSLKSIVTTTGRKQKRT